MAPADGGSVTRDAAAPTRAQLRRSRVSAFESSETSKCHRMRVFSMRHAGETATALPMTIAQIRRNSRLRRFDVQSIDVQGM